jgi:hypothetical protein
VADLKITELAALAGVDLAAGDLLAIADISASETKKITVTDFLGNAVTLIADATIPGAKILFGSATVPGSALEEGAVTASKLAAGAVTAAKLANESTVDLVTSLPASGAFTGQFALDTDDNKAYIWDGSQWVSFKAAGSINTAIGSTAGVVNVTVTTSGDQITIGTTLDDTANAAEFLAGPSGAGGAVSYRIIAGADLPVATTTAKGGVQVNGNGLAMSGDTLTVDNTVTPNTTEYHLIQYDGNGLVTDGREIEAGDLPLASVGLVGAVYPGTGLAVSNDGELNHTNVIAAGTATKITFDAEGHVTAGDALADTDIPNISAAKLTSGTLDVGRIANNTIAGEKLANYATAKISNAAPTAEYIGQLFFNPLDRTLFMWDGNVYQPIGVSFGQIIFSGTYDANTNLVSSVTTDGAAIGLAVGASLVSPTGATRAHYVVVDTAGTGTAPVPAVALAPPDIILSTGTDWTLLDVSDTVVAQLASNVQVTPAGDISTTNVQAALQELDTEKLPKAGGTMTGNLELGAAVNIIFEGANANAHETTLTVVDPTADRTITLPNVTGTVITTADSGTVTSTMILDGTIVNADINASAAIADTKLATIATALKVSNSATTAASANTASAIVARDGSGNFTAGTITAALTGAASSNVLKAGDTMTGPLITPLGSDSVPSITFTGDLNTGIYSPGADQVAISTNAVERVEFGTSEVVFNDGGANYDFRIEGDTNANLLFVDASTDRVGLGTSSPAALLTVVRNGTVVSSGLDASTALTVQSTASAGSSTHLNILAGSTGSTAQSVLTFGDADNPGIGAIRYRHADNSLAVETNASEQIRVDSAGRVGIGTTSPSALLEVNGETRLTRSGLSGQYISVAGDSSVNEIKSISTASKTFKIVGDTNCGSLELTTVPSVPIVFKTGDAERARIDSSGRLLVGTSSADTTHFANVGKVFIEGITDAGSSLIQTCWSASDASQAFHILAKSGGASVGTRSIVAADEQLGQIAFEGDDGTNFIRAASIRAAVDGTPGTDDMPGRLVFSTTADGAATPTERMRITSAGVLQVADAGNITVGTTTGTKIGTSTTQKIGFYNATPVVQPTAVADATDAATVITQLNALLTRMRNLGLIAT